MKNDSQTASRKSFGINSLDMNSHEIYMDKIITLLQTNIAMENPPFWWYLPGQMVIFMGELLVSGRVPVCPENPQPFEKNNDPTGAVPTSGHDVPSGGGGRGT